MCNMIKYCVYCQPKSKKSAHRAGVSKNGKPFLYLSTEQKKWESDVSTALSVQRLESEYPCVDYECWARILIYRQYNRLADLSNLIQSIEDALQRAGCIENDRLIRSLDGSRVYYGVNGTEARFEVTLAPFIDRRI